MSKIKIGCGIFMWDAYERQTNRYGAFWLSGTTYNETDNCKVVFEEHYLENFVGKKVRITCQVIEARKSEHIGDAFLHIKPSQPDVDEEVDLGVGVFDIGFRPGNHNLQLILKPGDGRKELWINPHKLYRLHDQTVNVFLEETDEDFTPAVEIKMEQAGVIVVEDNTYQTKKAEVKNGMKVKAKAKKIGEGAFILMPPAVGERAELYKEKK